MLIIQLGLCLIQFVLMPKFINVFLIKEKRKNDQCQHQCHPRLIMELIQNLSSRIENFSQIRLVLSLTLIQFLNINRSYQWNCYVVIQQVEDKAFVFYTSYDKHRCRNKKVCICYKHAILNLQSACCLIRGLYQKSLDKWRY